MIRRGLVFLFFIFVFLNVAYPQDRVELQETGSDICINKKDGTVRSRRDFTVERVFQTGRDFYRIKISGAGDYDKYTDIYFDFVSEMEKKGDFLYPLKTVQAIRNKNGELIIEWQKEYNYSDKKIYYTATNKDSRVLARKIFPIKGRVVDDVVLGGFVRAIAADIDNKSYGHFYLLSNEPALYEINVLKVGYEDFTTPSGKVSAVKIRLIPDFGIMTGVTKALVPPTYLWLMKDDPYTNLAYEGLEAGIDSAYITITKTK